MPTRLRIILIAIIVLMMGLGFVLGWTLMQEKKTVGSLRNQIIHLTEKILKQDYVLRQKAEADLIAKASESSEDNFKSLSLISKEKLERATSLNRDKMKQAIEISPGVILGVFGGEVLNEEGDPATGEIVWFLDLNRQQFHHLLDAPLGEGGPVRISKVDWPGGFVVEAFSSPGEAVGNIERSYIDSTGKVLARILSGDYGRPGDVVEATIGLQPLTIRLMHDGDCTNRIPGEENDATASFPPLTTLTGLNVNGRNFFLSERAVTSCYAGYGDSVGDPQLPTPDFDGQRITFHLPGYDVTVSATGAVTYAPKISYSITCEFGKWMTAEGDAFPTLRLLREDTGGIHELDANIWDDSVIRRFQDGQTCFSFSGTQGQKARFIVRSQTQYYQAEYNGEPAEDMGTIDYNLTTKAFENLQLK